MVVITPEVSSGMLPRIPTIYPEILLGVPLPILSKMFLMIFQTMAIGISSEFAPRNF